ncbi:MAG TPA: FAD-dependent oxidoreductase [Candidatus Fimimorpha excrementavium]|nr:FAD-dependent oxidoreductase [Candidatus Fimimorpha excrementavium]
MITDQDEKSLKTVVHKADFCVVGGGLAGMAAAVSAARRGISVVLMHDRPVLGGNASSEIRMWIRGAEGENVRETGLLEEIALENSYRNPDMNFSIWDSVLFGLVKEEKNITLLLNCSCCQAKMDSTRIVSVTGWQTTTQTWHTVSADYFSDCSGDSILAPLTGAKWRMGREGREEFGEDIAPETSDTHTMGLSCLIQARQTNHPVTFRAPKWAYHYTKEDFPYRINFSSPEKWTNDNFWWMEIGGTKDAIHDAEELRDELIRIAYGVWDFIKNGNEVEASCWDLDWMGFLPGKRESRRYVGDYILNQNDVRSEGRFEDLVAYGGWTMDDHDPRGFETKERPNIWHPAPSPYGIPYRCVYSVNIDNLFFAGRNISATHVANASARVMGTCALLGQAVGTAASLCVRHHCQPRDISKCHIRELKQALMEDDCYLPWNRKEMDAVMEGAAIQAAAGNDPSRKTDASVLMDGVERMVDGIDHAWEGTTGDELILTLPQKRAVRFLRLVMDSDLNRTTWKEQKWYIQKFPTKCNIFLDDKPVTVPGTILKSYEVWLDYGDGTFVPFKEVNNNYQRLNKIPIGKQIKRLKLIPREVWSGCRVRLYAMEVLG